MPQLIPNATLIQAAGNKPKQIREYVGQVNSGTTEVSVAHMISPQGWAEPGQRPEFTEYTIVLRGTLRVEHELGDPIDVLAGQGIITMPGEWVRYSTPGEDGAEYIAVCTPAFCTKIVFRDSE